MEIVAIVLSLFLLVTFAYRGFSVILFAPIFALFAASFSGLPILPGYTELFMAKAVTYIKSFFPVFLLGVPVFLLSLFHYLWVSRSFAAYLWVSLSSRR